MGTRTGSRMPISSSRRRGWAGVAPAVPALLVLTSAYLANLLGVALHEEWLWTAAAHAETAGVAIGTLAALLAAAARVRLPAGARDPGRRRWGASLHVLALVLFALARWVRGSARVSPDPAIVLVQGIGLALLALAAWAGRRPAGARTAPAALGEAPAEVRG